MPELNADLALPAVVRAAELAWEPSPSPDVWRKRFYLHGPAESGRVTSLVRYARGSRFPAHEHPDGEELLILEGVFSDEAGDWGAGSYLLNPEGFRHAPRSAEGCLLFVKLRQYPGRSRPHVTIQTRDLAWQADGSKPLYSERSQPETMRLERWSGDLGERVHPDGVELFVIDGSFSDEAGHYDRFSWLRLPPGHRHHPQSEHGCELYARRGDPFG